jgi:hypothetical protein
VLCPAALAPVLATKLDLLDSDVIFYEGTLWAIEDGASLSIVVLGVLNIDPEVHPELLAERVAQVHNRGLIAGTPDQVAVLQLRTSDNSGDWIDRSDGEPEEEGPASQGTIVNLEL